MSKVAWVGLSVAAFVVGAAMPAMSQETAPTAGGDVTADEATPLPPVVVQAPKERRKPARAPARPKAAAAAAAAAAAVEPSLEAVATGGEADEANAFAPGASIGVFTLGQLDLIGGSTITNEAMWVYNKQSLDQALDIMPGVTTHNAGGGRNESDIFVRGFDRFRVPLSLDGVRIYLPADNRLDFNRFLTPDLAEIQVQKGYVSVLNGPGGMGGAINLVSRKPTKPVELEGRVGAVFNGDADDLNAWNSYAFAGTRQDQFYAQISGNIFERDQFNLSNDFRVTNPVNEDGGDRDHSSFDDWRINAKVGFTPNVSDEYVLNYTVQQGSKEVPLHTAAGGQRVQGPRFWDWPQWDTSTASWLSKTQIGDKSYVKTNAYYNTFESKLRFFNSVTYDTLLNADSPYEDSSYGGFVEAGTQLIPMNTLKAAIHYRHDSHSERDGPGFTPRKPKIYNIEDTWSFALENTFHATRNFDFVTGVSYDMNAVDKAESWDRTNPTVITQQPRPEVDAWNAQGAAIYRYSDSGKTHASISSRTRFPTAFERYSTRFGARVPNPFLKPERSTNYEVGVSDTLFRNMTVSSSLFYSDLEDALINVFTGNGMGSIRSGNASGEHYGMEASLDWRLSPVLRFGGNYTYLERDLDFRNATGPDFATDAAIQAALAANRVEGTPRHEAFVYLSWDATSKLTLTPSVEIASDRTAMITSCNSTLLTNAQKAGCPAGTPVAVSPLRPNFVDIGAYTRLNLQMEYRINDMTTAAIGATNLLDQDYALAEGFPDPGRQFFANVRAKF